MKKKMKKFEIFIRKIPWSFIGVLVALIFGILGIYSMVREKKPNILYEIINEANVLDVRKPLKDLSISFQGEDIQKENLNLRILTVRVENNGEVDILQGHYDAGDIWGVQVQNARVIEARLINSNSEYLKSKLNPNVIEDDKIKLNKIIFEKGKFFVLEILVIHEKALKPEIIPFGKIAGIDRIVLVKSWEEQEKQPFMTKLFYGNAFMHFLRFIFYVLVSIVIGVTLGLSASKFSAFINKRKSELRKREIIKVFGKDSLEVESKKKFLYEYYIKHGGENIKSLNELLKDKERLIYEVQTFEIDRKFSKKHGLIRQNLEIAPPSTEREFIRKAYYMQSPIQKLLEDGVITLGVDNKVNIEKEFKRALHELLKYLEVVEKK